MCYKYVREALHSISNCGPPTFAWFAAIWAELSGLVPDNSRLSEVVEEEADPESAEHEHHVQDTGLFVATGTLQ